MNIWGSLEIPRSELPGKYLKFCEGCGRPMFATLIPTGGYDPDSGLQVFNLKLKCPEKGTGMFKFGHDEYFVEEFDYEETLSPIKFDKDLNEL